MASSLSDRMKGRFNADGGAGFRANPMPSDSTVGMDSRAGAGSGADDNQITNTMPGSIHTSSGFRRALEHTERTQGSGLSGDIASRQHFGGKGFKKPNYFAQGGKRHGMHIGSGAPAIVPSEQTGSDAGGD